jgi:hypothetical protein
VVSDRRRRFSSAGEEREIASERRKKWIHPCIPRARRERYGGRGSPHEKRGRDEVRRRRARRKFPGPKSPQVTLACHSTYTTTRGALCTCMFSASRADLPGKLKEKNSHPTARVERQGSQSWARMGFICLWMDSGMSFPVPEKFLPRRPRLGSVFFPSLSHSIRCSWRQPFRLLLSLSLSTHTSTTTS